MTGQTDLPSHDNMAPYLSRSRDTRLGRYHGMGSDHHVVTHLDEIIEFCPLADDRTS